MTSVKTQIEDQKKRPAACGDGASLMCGSMPLLIRGFVITVEERHGETREAYWDRAWSTARRLAPGEGESDDNFLNLYSTKR